MKEEVLSGLSALKRKLREQIRGLHLEFTRTDLEFHDLSPFIPGFTLARAKIAIRPKREAPSSSQSGDPLKERILVNVSISSERLEALEAWEAIENLDIK